MNKADLTIDQLTEAADEQEGNGNLAEAFELWTAASEKARDPEIFCRFGDLAMRLGKISEAETAFRSASEIDPELRGAYSLRGILYLENERLEEAVEQFEHSLKIEKTASILTLLGVAHLELGLNGNAISDLEEAIRLDASYEEAYYNLGLAYRESQPSKSIELFERALEIDREYAHAHRELGWVYRGLDRYPESEYHLRRAIELDDKDGWAYIYLGNTLWAEGDLVSAEEFFKTSMAVWPDDSIPIWCLALFYEYEDRPAEALALYDQAFRIDPGDPIATQNFRRYLLATGQQLTEPSRRNDPETTQKKPEM